MLARVRAAYVALWSWIFVLALALELPIVALAAPRGRRVRAVIASVLGNAITHPALWFVWPRLLPWTAALLFGEACAIGVEGASLLVIGRLSPKRAFLIAAAANLYSWAVGELVVRGIGRALVRYWFGT